MIPSSDSSSESTPLEKTTNESASESTTSEKATSESASESTASESTASETTGSESTASESTASETTGSESTTESTGSEKSYETEEELSDNDNAQIVVHVIRNETEIPPIISWTCFVFMLVQLVRLFKLLTGGSMEVGPGYYGPCY